MTHRELAIVGGGELASALVARNRHISSFCISREDRDISSQINCDEVVKDISGCPKILITAGVFNHDAWQTWLVNTVAPCYIIQQLVVNGYQGHIAVISSNAANWTSWPGADIDRVVYNCSKHATSGFAAAMVQRKSNVRITVIEPSRFQSTMSGQTGKDPAEICAIIEEVFWGKLQDTYNIKISNQGHGNE